MKKIQLLVITLLGAGLMACSSLVVKNSSATLIPVQQNDIALSKLEATISPYRDSVDQQMNEVLALAPVNFLAERPSGNLNNWTADALFTNQLKQVRDATPVMCLLNFGGLRSSINAGPVTLGDIFKLSPFDNLVVWATLPIEVLPEIEQYLIKSGGEPISGAKLVNGKLIIDGMPTDSKEFIVITSDYLANGGDKMHFFKKATHLNETGIVLRDCLIEEAKTQQTLINNPENRISIK